MRRRSDNGDEMHDAFGSQGRGGNRSYGAGGGYYSAPTDRIKETNHNIMEMQNNAHIDDLSDQVGIDYYFHSIRNGGEECLSFIPRSIQHSGVCRTDVHDGYVYFIVLDTEMRADQRNLWTKRNVSSRSIGNLVNLSGMQGCTRTVYYR